MKRNKESKKHNEESKHSSIEPENFNKESKTDPSTAQEIKENTKKRKSLRKVVIIILCILLAGGAFYQGYRVVRDFVLRKVIVFFLENEQQQSSQKNNNDTAEGEKMDIHDVAAAFERLNGVEPESSPEKTTPTKPVNNEQLAKDIVSQIPEADKNRAIAIVSSVASVDDCFALYELAINGDQNAKKQLKEIYARFTQAQTDELWALYEKHKHLLE